VGKRNRAADDPRDKLAGYDTIDVTGTVENLFLRGLTLRAGGKNVFDTDVRYPSGFPGYPEDYPQPGREWWVQLSYKF